MTTECGRYGEAARALRSLLLLCAAPPPPPSLPPRGDKTAPPTLVWRRTGYGIGWSPHNSTPTLPRTHSVWSGGPACVVRCQGWSAGLTLGCRTNAMFHLLEASNPLSWLLYLNGAFSATGAETQFPVALYDWVSGLSLFTFSVDSGDFFIASAVSTMLVKLVVTGFKLPIKQSRKESLRTEADTIISELENLGINKGIEYDAHERLRVHVYPPSKATTRPCRTGSTETLLSFAGFWTP
eukprot:gene16836-25818_t